MTPLQRYDAIDSVLQQTMAKEAKLLDELGITMVLREPGLSCWMIHGRNGEFYDTARDAIKAKETPVRVRKTKQTGLRGRAQVAISEKAYLLKQEEKKRKKKAKHGK